MVIAALVLLVLAQDPDPFPGLLARLADENLAVRDDAAAALVKLGEPALGRLRASNASAGEADLRLRLADVIARIEADVRRRKFTGGEEVDGLRARLTVESATVKAGEGVKLTLEIMNIGETTRDFLVPVSVARQGPGLLSVRNSWSAIVKVVQSAGDAPTLTATLRGCCGRSLEPATVTLAPGAIWKQTVTLPTRLPDAPETGGSPRWIEGLQPGEFEIRFTYPEAMGITRDLVSDTLKVQVTK